MGPRRHPGGLRPPARNRSYALLLFGIWVVLDVVSVILAIVDRDYFWGVAVTVVGTAWCWLAIRWVDKYGRWPEVG